MKKTKIENTIRKHQEDLKILEETMENIGDGKDFILQKTFDFFA